MTIQSLIKLILHCKSCESAFYNIRDVNIHTLKHHSQLESCTTNRGNDLSHGSDVEETQQFNPSNTSSLPVEDEEPSDAEVDYEEFIPQVDGISDRPENNFSNIRNRWEMQSSSSLLNLSSIQPNTSNTVRPEPPFVSDPGISVSCQAPYILNKEKQISNLAKHANICNFEIDRTGPHNTNIQCSTGFYEAVPKPALTTIKEGFRQGCSRCP